jgi:CTP synthase (UTP-ammonia lyase)
MRPVVTVLIDLPADHPYHRATLAALGHASEHRGIPIEVQVLPTDTIRDAARIATAGSAVVIGPGSPYRDPEAANAVVREARERNVPLVGT